MSVGENYQLAYTTIEALGVQKDLSVACLIDPNDKTHDFIELAARNAWYNVRLFHDEAAAIAWLCKENSGK